MVEYFPFFLFSTLEKKERSERESFVCVRKKRADKKFYRKQNHFSAKKKANKKSIFTLPPRASRFELGDPCFHWLCREFVLFTLSEHRTERPTQVFEKLGTFSPLLQLRRRRRYLLADVDEREEEKREKKSTPSRKKQIKTKQKSFEFSYSKKDKNACGYWNDSV